MAADQPILDFALGTPEAETYRLALLFEGGRLSIGTGRAGQLPERFERVVHLYQVSSAHAEASLLWHQRLLNVCRAGLVSGAGPRLTRILFLPRVGRSH